MGNGQAQRVLIVDDHALFREGLASVLQNSARYEVIDQAGSVEEGVKKALKLRPDIILMDFSLPDGTGLDATTAILEEHPGCKIVFLTIYETDENLLAAIRSGAKGYVLKNVTGPSLIASLDALAQGELAISRKMMSRALEASSASVRLPTDSNPKRLSRREMEILQELEKGASNLEIARHLYLSENTVKHHVHSILSKLGAESRGQLIQLARKKNT
jgi:two-component system nitrate/nitrite response regulator NarL